MKTSMEQAQAIFEELVEIRRDFHMHPELSLQEYRTAEKIEEYLTKWGIEHERIAHTGVVGIVRGREGGKVVAIRADIDALPITEVEDRPYRSQNEGVMHACGHDMHATILLGAAKVFKGMEGNFDGTVKFFFQPAEEAQGGAKRMIEAGCMENPRVDHVIGLHVHPTVPAGKLQFKSGAFCAMSCRATITIRGKAGHAARPNTAIDAVAVACQVVSSLQMIVSRQVSPLDSVVLTFGSIHGGTKANIIADEVVIDGTLRTLSREMREDVEAKINQVANQVAGAYGATAEVVLNEGYPALINDAESVDVTLKVAEGLVGRDNIVMMENPSMGGEDFSFFSDLVPSAFYNLGCGNEAKGMTATLHHEAFDADEDCIPLGVAMQVESALALMKKK
jgi:amidohydrolase